MDKTEFETIRVDVNNRVATISLNRPHALNAFNFMLREELLEAIESANADENVRIVIITGSGRGFSAGADLSEDYQERHDSIERQILEEYKPFLMAIHEAPKIYISAINGVAAGIGGALAMVCDLSLMAEEAYLYQAFAAIGLIPDGGASWHLLNTMGYKRAFESIVGARKLSAQDCLELGLVNYVVPAENIKQEAQQWAERLAAGAPLVQKYVKEVLRKAIKVTLSEVIDLEARYQNITITSDDAIEGGAAFFEKRPPRFSGK